MATSRTAGLAARFKSLARIDTASAALRARLGRPAAAGSGAGNDTRISVEPPRAVTEGWLVRLRFENRGSTSSFDAQVIGIAGARTRIVGLPWDVPWRQEARPHVRTRTGESTVLRLCVVDPRAASLQFFAVDGSTRAAVAMRADDAVVVTIRVRDVETGRVANEVQLSIALGDEHDAPDITLAHAGDLDGRATAPATHAPERDDASRFFDAYPRFYETTETGHAPDRLNARYVALIDANRDAIDGATVLDLASHDGRFSFAAIRTGAAKVIGIEYDPALVAKSCANMEAYGVPRERYDFIVGDVFEKLDEIEHVDVVFCFGLFYHVNDHVLLLSKIAALDPQLLILDTNVSQVPEAVIELRPELPGGTQVIGWPSRAGLDAMLTRFGWPFEYFDWPRSGLLDSPQLNDYRIRERLTVVARCGDRVPEAPRAGFVTRASVIARREGRASVPDLPQD